MEELRERLRANLEAAKVAMEAAAADPFPVTGSGYVREHPGFAVASRCDDAAVKIARQLRLAGQELPVDVEDPFADLVARRKDVDWQEVHGAGGVP